MTGVTRERVYLNHWFVLRVTTMRPLSRRWTWHVRYRTPGQSLLSLDRADGGVARTSLGARWALRRWRRRREGGLSA